MLKTEITGKKSKCQFPSFFTCLIKTLYGKVFFLLFFLIFNSSFFILNCFSQWVLQNPYPQPNPLLKVQALSNNVIYACGSGKTIIKSTNGGVNWMVYSNNIPDWNFPYGSAVNSISFVSSDTGYFCGSKGRVFKTVNGGINWTEMQTGITTDLYTLQFMNQYTGYSAGMSGVIIKTTNGGINWFSQPGGGTASLLSMFFTDVNNGWICGTLMSGNILKTTERTTLPLI